MGFILIVFGLISAISFYAYMVSWKHYHDLIKVCKTKYSGEEIHGIPGERRKEILQPVWRIKKVADIWAIMLGLSLGFTTLILIREVTGNLWFGIVVTSVYIAIAITIAVYFRLEDVCSETDENGQWNIPD